VKSLAAYAIKHEGIARMIGLRSVKTLRKHFREELVLGLFEAVAQVCQTHYQMARSGKHAACTIDFLNRRARYLDVHMETEPAATPDFVVTVEKKAA
jgi:hypothetical protein